MNKENNDIALFKKTISSMVVRKISYYRVIAVYIVVIAVNLNQASVEADAVDIVIQLSLIHISGSRSCWCPRHAE